jgi:two-component system response regulator FlrC
VRELENVVQRALILHQNGVINSGCLVFEEGIDGHFLSLEQDVNIDDIATVAPVSTETSQINARLGDSVRSAEENIILQTLKDQQGSRKITAEKLGISPRTLRYKIARMKEAGVAVPC